jgi:hypothetical protein
MYDNTHMTSAKPTMTQLLRQSLHEAGSLYAVAKGSGLDYASLHRFKSGQCSLRLDKADKLAAHLGIECRRTRRRKG